VRTHRAVSAHMVSAPQANVIATTVERRVVPVRPMPVVTAAKAVPSTATTAAAIVLAANVHSVIARAVIARKATVPVATVRTASVRAPMRHAARAVLSRRGATTVNVAARPVTAAVPVVNMVAPSVRWAIVARMKASVISSAPTGLPSVATTATVTGPATVRASIAPAVPPSRGTIAVRRMAKAALQVVRVARSTQAATIAAPLRATTVVRTAHGLRAAVPKTAVPKAAP